MHDSGDEIERVQSAFNTVVARRRGRWVDMDVEGATYASWHPELLLTGYSWDAISAAALLAGEPSSILLLGLGGGTCLHQLRVLVPRARLVAVEIDPEVVGLARRHMNLDAVDVEVHIADADDYLANTNECFDAVLDDLYLTGAEDVFRGRVPDGERLDSLRAHCTPSGLVAANLIDDRGHQKVRSRARKAFRVAFPQSSVVRPPRGLNEIVVGGSALKDRHSLRRFRDRFSEQHDRDFWARLSVRKLR